VDLSALIAESLLHTRSDAIIGADGDGMIRFWNPGAERIFGHTAADAIGQSLDLIIPERLRRRHWEGYHGHDSNGTQPVRRGRRPCRTGAAQERSHHLD
jgi:PAS domain S-box-containing protein